MNGSRPSLRTAVRTGALVLVALVVVTVAAGAGFVHAVSPATRPSDAARLVTGDRSSRGSLGFAIDHDQRINVLLLARGGAGGDDPNFTDTIILMSIRPSTRHVTLVSLPRYLWVAIPVTSRTTVEGKLYAAYALAADARLGSLSSSWSGPTGPGDLAAATAAGVLGEPVPHWMAVDTDAFAPLIDAMGGITIDIPEALDDPAYPTDEAGHTMHVHFDAGPQTLTGSRALEYARSRLSTSDADRSRRQELVVMGIVAAAHHHHIGVPAPWALATIAQGFRTNLRLDEIHDLASVLSGVREQDVVRVSLEDSGLLVAQPLGNSEILLPADGTYTAVRSYVAAALP